MTRIAENLWCGRYKCCRLPASFILALLRGRGSVLSLSTAALLMNSHSGTRYSAALALAR